MVNLAESATTVPICLNKGQNPVSSVRNLVAHNPAVASCAHMKLTWKDHEEVAWALMDKFPDQDPLKLSFPKLHKMVLELDEFGDDPNSSNF